MNKFKFGIEIECGTNILRNFIDHKESNYYGDYRLDFSRKFRKIFKNWIISSDGSISYNYNFEFKSPILTLEKLDNIENICKVLKESHFEVNKSCGLHVHINIDSLEEAKKIATFYSILNKDDLFKIAKRKENKYCQKVDIGNFFDLSKDDFKKRNYNYLQKISKFEKYESVNVLPLNWSKPNIEFRQHKGTISFKEIKEWILFLDALRTKALNMSFKEIVNLYFLSKEEKNTIYKELLNSIKD